MTTKPSSDSWVTCPRPRPHARLRLFCLPYAGGGASLYRAWPDQLPSEVELHPIQLPGRENRLKEPAFSRITHLVPALAHALQPLLDRPYALFGHSMGALICFEVARSLRRQGEPGPSHLFVSGCRAPQLPNPDPPIHLLHDAAFLEALRRLNGTPEGVLRNAELMRLLAPTLRADFAIHETYSYTAEDPLLYPISAFGGLDDHEVSQEELTAWSEQTEGEFRLRMLPGTHFFIHASGQQVLQAVSCDLLQSLARLGEG